MNNQNLIIYDHKILYDIFYELKNYLSFEVIFMSKEEIAKSLLSNEKNYIILTTKDIPSVSNFILLENLPSNFFKLIERINIMFLKQKYNDQSNIKVKNYEINLNSREISSNDIKLKLTEKEINIILYLMKNKGEVSVKNLQSQVWGYQKDLETHTVETHIHRLRKKILNNFKDNNFIKSKKNGYQIN